MDLFEVLAVVSDWLFANASKTFILLRWLFHKITTLPQSCQAGLLRISDKLPHRKRGKFSRAAKRNEFGWPVQEVNEYVEEETVSPDVLDLQVPGDLVPGDGQHDGVLC